MFYTLLVHVSAFCVSLENHVAAYLPNLDSYYTKLSGTYYYSNITIIRYIQYSIALHSNGGDTNKKVTSKTHEYNIKN